MKVDLKEQNPDEVYETFNIYKICMCVFVLCVREKRRRKQEMIFWDCDEAKQMKKEEKGEACE